MHVAICSERLVVHECATLFEFHPCLRFSHREAASVPESGWVYSERRGLAGFKRYLYRQIGIDYLLACNGRRKFNYLPPILSTTGLYLE